MHDENFGSMSSDETHMTRMYCHQVEHVVRNVRSESHFITTHRSACIRKRVLQQAWNQIWNDQEDLWCLIHKLIYQDISMNNIFSYF